MASNDLIDRLKKIAKYHEERAGYGGASYEFHARAQTTIEGDAVARIHELEREKELFDAEIGKLHLALEQGSWEFATNKKADELERELLKFLCPRHDLGHDDIDCNCTDLKTAIRERDTLRAQFEQVKEKRKRLRHSIETMTSHSASGVTADEFKSAVLWEMDVFEIEMDRLEGETPDDKEEGDG